MTSPPDKVSIAFNGRFLAADLSGVHRVAAEIINAFDSMVAADADLSARIVGRLIRPPGSRSDFQLKHFDVVEGGQRKGQAWEQIDLPGLVGDDLLIGFGNLAPIRHRRSIAMVHDAQVFLTPGSYSTVFRTWYRFAHRRMGARGLRILTVSEFSKSKLVDFGVAPAEKIGVIHNGVDHILREAADPTILEKLNLHETPFVVGLANTQAHKNIRVLLDAFRMMAEQNAKLVLFGPASKADFEKAGLLPPESTIFAGRISDGALRALLERALCLAFPSTTEGFGLPPLEALRLGCPVVAAPCGALPETCGEGAAFASPDEATQWSDLFQSLMLEPTDLRDARKRRGEKWAGRFTWRAAAERLLNEIEIALADERRASQTA